MSGEKTDEKPHISMPVYRFSQWIFGYRSLKELSEEEEIEILDKEASEVLDKEFPKQRCHIIDEY